MPITLEEIIEHKNYFGFESLETMPEADYKQLIEKEAFFWLDHHEFIRHQLSGEIIATNKEQLDMLIEYLKSFRERLPNQIQYK
ncbi:hypothetical protein A9G13_07565 [Gilliamella sp. wkB178]|uniref:hypothetical protein n=1 Tax=Gilliamella sp. wkB178 TaxID=3120259 RepID=UPI00080EDEBB|nr:hypothetical protein [Gilliamella apicola]OCG08045.1 hypothetical protein A9G13_07565 [Gilliamella apicola]